MLKKIISYPFKLILLGLVYIYKYVISPRIPHTCRFTPTCSNYLIRAIKEWGVIKGCALGLKRICKCRPRGKCGEDFVPLNIKGDKKWVY